MVKGHELGPDEVSDRQASACPDTPGELGERHVKLLRRQVDQREPRKDSTETAVPLIKSSGVAEPKLETVVRATRLVDELRHYIDTGDISTSAMEKPCPLPWTATDVDDSAAEPPDPLNQPGPIDVGRRLDVAEQIDVLDGSS